MSNYKLLTAKQISEATNIPVRSCYRLPLRWVKIARSKRVLESDFQKYMEEKLAVKP